MEYRVYGNVFYKEYIGVVFPCSRLRTSGDILTVRPVVPSRDVKLPLVVYFPGFRAKALQTSPDELQSTLRRPSLRSPIILPYILPCTIPVQEFRLWLKRGAL